MPPITDPAPNSYDEVPYPSVPKPETHPDSLATIATLFGMQPARPSRCRLLEIGCSDGGNIIPMAYALPESEFVGIDLSARQIEAGQSLIAALGLTNISLQQLDILDLDVERIGRFDYIVAYGVFSWVPEHVREKILDFCRQSLNPQGVAFISYNTFPGWHARLAIREIMQYHNRQQGITSLAEGAHEARRLLEELSESVDQMNARVAQGATETYYSLTLKGERVLLGGRPDWYLVHELLEEHNEPMYFYEFAARVERHGLAYLGDAGYATMDPANLPPPVAAMVNRFGKDVIGREQYMDLVRNRTFRQSLLVHRTVAVSGTLSPECVLDRYIASRAKPVSERPDIQSNAVEKFRGPSGTVLTSSMPLAKAAMVHLSEIAPNAIPFEAVMAAAHQRVNPDAVPIYSAEQLARERRALSEMLLRCFSLDLVELRIEPPRFVSHVSSRPTASALARLQAEVRPTVTNLCHENVDLADDVALPILRHLDGDHGVDDMLAMMEQLVARGDFSLLPDGKPVEDAEQRRALLVAALRRGMERLVRSALLVS